MNLLSPDHGTVKALRRHKIYGTSVCDACLAWQDRLEQDAARLYMDRFRRRTSYLPMTEAS